MGVHDDDNTSHLTVMMTELVTKMQVLLDKQDELAENISKIKEAVYNPDNGLYARLSRLDARLEILESWKNNNVRIVWLMATATIGLLATTAWQAIF